MSTTIRVSERTRDRFAKLASATGRPMTQLLDEAVDALERRVFFDQLAVGYDALRADADAWSKVGLVDTFDKDKWLYAMKRGWRPRTLAVGTVCHWTPQCNRSRSR
jgi:predicted transcriptional regulator